MKTIFAYGLLNTTNTTKYFCSAFKYAVWLVTHVKQYGFYSLTSFLQRPELSGKNQKGIERGYRERDKLLNFLNLISFLLKKVPYVRLHTCSSAFKRLMFFLRLQLDLSRWCFTQHIYSEPCLVHTCFEFLLQEARTGLSLASFTAFKSKCQHEGSQRCLLSCHISHYFTYLPALWMGHLCFTSCWLRGALQVCKGHRTRRLCIYSGPGGIRSHWASSSPLSPEQTMMKQKQCLLSDQKKKKKKEDCFFAPPEPHNPLSHFPMLWHSSLQVLKSYKF